MKCKLHFVKQLFCPCQKETYFVWPDSHLLTYMSCDNPLFICEGHKVNLTGSLNKDFL